MSAGTVLDLVLVIAAVLAAGVGYRLGLLRRFVSWVGLGVGLVIGATFLPNVVARLSALSPAARLTVALMFVIGLALAGQGIGMLLGDHLRANVTLGERGVRVDRAAGAALGVIGVLIGVWLLAPAFASAPGWPARAARESVVVRGVDRYAPRPPSSLVALGRLVAEAPFPDVFEELTGSPEVGAPPDSGLAPATEAAVGRSVVKVEGEACGRIQDGSGWVAAAGEIVTNAHVVAGERATTVVTTEGERLKARVVAFDTRRDLAVLRVDGLRAPALALGAGAVGDTGAVFGFPGGGALRAAPARVAQEVTAVGRDLYGNGGVHRDVFVLAASLRPGDSGGALVNADGAVIGVAFAVDPGTAGTAYAVTDTEVRAVLGSVQPRPVDTGPCLVG